MTARVTIYDDNGNPNGAYELKPSRIYEGGISTKYVFEFEYNKLNDEYRKSEDVVSERSLCDSCKNRRCIYQIGIVRKHCDYYKAESEAEDESND